jgi:CRISPR-associated protein Cas5t
MVARVLRVEVEGTTTSFRYPHFLVGRQPSYLMPPPATIYGHIASALGEFPDRSKLRFAYAFHAIGRGDDLEHTHLVEVASRRFDKSVGFVKNLEGIVNPVRREIMLLPTLVLYLDALEELELDRLQQAFREPRYPVVLGRSQDLAAYRSVQMIELQEATAGYLEGTLLPWTWRLKTSAGIMATMPRFIDPADRKRVEWAPYVVLERRVHIRDDAEPSTSVIQRKPNETVLIDPLSPEYQGLRRAVVWLRFDGDEA